ncbi:hypothetical protein Fmac_008474 [Flemingia macrophylla]|uniref:Uncharacterized protein n=1 Tax=Flemingia macrophylla TaxID=520843 RepID=A0ABD1MXH3_9FABA
MNGAYRSTTLDDFNVQCGFISSEDIYTEEYQMAYLAKLDYLSVEDMLSFQPSFCCPNPLNLKPPPLIPLATNDLHSRNPTIVPISSAVTPLKKTSPSTRELSLPKIDQKDGLLTAKEYPTLGAGLAISVALLAMREVVLLAIHATPLLLCLGTIESLARVSLYQQFVYTNCSSSLYQPFFCYLRFSSL